MTIIKADPWIMRTYAGYGSPQETNALYRKNLAKKQTGLSVAFDLPTQTGWDADHPSVAGEVGKVGVPIYHLLDMELLFVDIPLEKMNTSMTINATAAWLLALYVATAERRGIHPRVLRGTTQNDILKEFLVRGTYIFPPEPSLHLTADMIEYTVIHMPHWNPINICSYHLQEAGATPVQNIAYMLANAFAVLDRVKDRPGVSMPDVVARMSFFVAAGIRFIEEMCKMKAFARLWDRYMLERYGVEDPIKRRMRYGVQSASLGLTAQQPENNAQRLAFELLGTLLSADVRARAYQSSAWNEALGLPRAIDQQWALRTQQVLALETDILEYQDDIFKGSVVIEKKVREIIDEATSELQRIEDLGGSVQALELMKQGLVVSLAQRLQQIESKDLPVVGVNCLVESDPSPLGSEEGEAICMVDPTLERGVIERLHAWRKNRNNTDVRIALQALEDAAKNGANIMPVSIQAAHAGVTTGEWGQALRNVFGEYRAPTGVRGLTLSSGSADIVKVRQHVQKLVDEIGHRPRLLVGKPGLDGHSNAAEQLTVAASNCGLDVSYVGIRLTPEAIVESALQEDVDVIGISIHSNAHMTLVPRIIELMHQGEMGNVPVFVGGIIPKPDREALMKLGVTAIYGPGEATMIEIVSVIVHSIARKFNVELYK